MSQIPNDLSEWEDCPTGKIQNLSHRVRRQVARAKKIAAAVSAVSVLVIGTLIVVRPQLNTPGFAGGISCKDVAANARRYLAGDLDFKLREMIDKHLAGCPHCERKFKEMKTGQHGPIPTPRAISHINAESQSSGPASAQPMSAPRVSRPVVELAQLGL